MWKMDRPYWYCSVFFTLSTVFSSGVDGGLPEVPSSVEVRSDVWQDNVTPVEDALDRFMVNNTGCSYRALRYGDDQFRLPVAVPFHGAQFEWRAAVRAGETARIVVLWRLGFGYHFRLGYDNNTKTTIDEWSTGKTWRLSTPGMLSADRYQEFYIRVRAGTLTFGREGDSAPLLTRAVTFQQGDQLWIEFESFSPYGGKFLYDCPATLSDARSTATGLIFSHLLMFAVISTFAMSLYRSYSLATA